MRKFRFRAWDNFTEKMYEVQDIDFFFGLMKLYSWEPDAEGTLTKVNVKDSVMVLGEVDEDLNEDSEVYKEIYNEVLGHELMQYTGLNDNEDKEIFEGDIIQVFTLRYTVFYDEEAAVWCCKSLDDEKEFFLFQFCMNEVEVVGNKFENPELLEVNRA